jgi:hypothetical protein
MNATLEEAMRKDEYSQLPEPIKGLYTREQYLWLSDLEKATLIQRETECEYEQ